MSELEQWIERFARENGLTIKLSYEMPKGREEWYCNYDVETQSLHINRARLERGRDFEAAYYLFHELRHAEQFFAPQRFDESVRKSVRYAVFYDGTCYKFENGKRRECRLAATEYDFVSLSESMPHELDAHRYACEQAILLFPQKRREILSLRDSWLPSKALSLDELNAAFEKIDKEAK